MQKRFILILTKNEAERNICADILKTLIGSHFLGKKVNCEESWVLIDLIVLFDIKRILHFYQFQGPNFNEEYFVLTTLRV